MVMACPVTDSDLTVPILLLKALSMIPTSHYIIASSIFLLIVLYNFLEFHVIGDALRGFRGDPVVLTFNPASKVYEVVVAKCRILHGRYLATPWLASPHIQTAFLNFFGNPPSFCYRRQLYALPDGGTIALDWLLGSDVSGGIYNAEWVISKEDTTPLVMVIPGLTSDSASPYLKHLAHRMARQGWNVVVGNHRGLGGVSVTSDCFYNAGWTEDLREVANYLHQEYPKAPLFAIGTSIGANILVKYLGEEGENTPFAGAAAICSPWDLLVCDRFINRKLAQRFYDRALAIGLKGYAQLHQTALTRLANWDGISNSRSIRDFDNHATCVVGKFETVDTYYRWSSSASFVQGVSIPLLCISALDDPLCTSEAIPWDECRANKNVILATSPHGGHLAFFKGITAHSLWWVEALGEFFSVLHSSPYMHGQKQMQNTRVHFHIDSSIDKSPYVNITEDGMIAAVRNDVSENDEAVDISDDQTTNNIKPESGLEGGERNGDKITTNIMKDPAAAPSAEQNEYEDKISRIFSDMTGPVKRSINQISRRSKRSIWLLAYIALVTTWPLIGSALRFVFRKKVMGAAAAGGFNR